MIWQLITYTLPHLRITDVGENYTSENSTFVLGKKHFIWSHKKPKIILDRVSLQYLKKYLRAYMARMGPIIPCQQPLILIFSMHSIRSTARIIGMGPKIVTFWPTSTVQCLFKYQRKSWFDNSYLLACLHFPSLSTNRENLKSKYNIVTVIRIVIIIFKRNTGNQERGILCQ